MNPIATTCWIIGCITIAAVILGAMVWSIRAVDRRGGARIARMTAEALAKPDDAYTASIIRSREIDIAYEQLVIEEHNKGTV